MQSRKKKIVFIGVINCHLYEKGNKQQDGI